MSNATLTAAEGLEARQEAQGPSLGRLSNAWRMRALVAESPEVREALDLAAAELDSALDEMGRRFLNEAEARRAGGDDAFARGQALGLELSEMMLYRARPAEVTT